MDILALLRYSKSIVQFFVPNWDLNFLKCDVLGKTNLGPPLSWLHARILSNNFDIKEQCLQPDKGKQLMFRVSREGIPKTTLGAQS